MTHDRDGGKRTNWLLIKHRDEFAVDGAGDALLDDNDTSVASGRTMDAITSGKGRRPRPFIVQTVAAKAGAASKTRHGVVAQARLKKPASKKARQGARSSMPQFMPPQLCSTASRPPTSDGWVHEIKFDGYRIQLHVETATRNC